MPFSDFHTSKTRNPPNATQKCKMIPIDTWPTDIPETIGYGENVGQLLPAKAPVDKVGRNSREDCEGDVGNGSFDEQDAPADGC